MRKKIPYKRDSNRVGKFVTLKCLQLFKGEEPLDVIKLFIVEDYSERCFLVSDKATRIFKVKKKDVMFIP